MIDIDHCETCDKFDSCLKRECKVTKLCSEILSHGVKPSVDAYVLIDALIMSLRAMYEEAPPGKGKYVTDEVRKLEKYIAERTPEDTIQ